MNTTTQLTPNLADQDRGGPPIRIASNSYLANKQRWTRPIACLLAVPLSPIIALLVLVVRVTSPGPGLYRQERVGLGGRKFTIFKLRTMRQDAEKLSGPVWSVKGDHRVTPVGKALRYLHLDELPQIYNVVRGEMAFVGPRPERPEIVSRLIGDVPGYECRLEAMPGITGLAQVNLPPDETLECVNKKVQADCLYIANASLGLDTRLVAATCLRILGVRYEKGARLLGVTLRSFAELPPFGQRPVLLETVDSNTVEVEEFENVDELGLQEEFDELEEETLSGVGPHETISLATAGASSRKGGRPRPR